MTNILTLLISTLSILSCNSESSSAKDNLKELTNKLDSTTIVIEGNADSNKHYTTKLFTVDFFGTLNYLDIISHVNKVKLTSPSVVNVGIGLNSKQFIIETGDVITINFSNDTIKITSKSNILCTKEDFQLYFMKKHPSFNSISDSLFNLAYTKRYFTKEYFEYVKKNTIKPSEYQEIGNNLKENNFQQYIQELLTLDSLLLEGRITKAYKEWISFKLKMEKIGNANVVDFFTPERNFKDNYTTYQFVNDSLLNSFFYEYKGYLSANFIPAAILKYNKIKFSNNQFGYDYKKVFDSASNYLGGLSLDYIKFVCLGHIKEENTLKVFNEYKNKFYAVAKDTSLVNYVKNNLDNTDAIKLNKNDLVKDINGQIRPLKDIITKGNVQYIDFWASWCSPCRKEIPFSIKLHKQYSAKNIDFIYISTDEDFAKWKNAVYEMQMQDLENSYILINQKESSIVKSQKINTLPRYLLFNNKGELVYKDAPSPSKPETKIIIDELLNIK